MRGRAAVREKTGAREEQRARADRSRQLRARRHLTDPVPHIHIVEQLTRAETAGDDEHVDPGCRREGDVRLNTETAGAPHHLGAARDRKDVERRRVGCPPGIDSGVSRVREKTSYGPAKSSTSTSSKMKIPTFSFCIPSECRRPRQRPSPRTVRRRIARPPTSLPVRPSTLPPLYRYILFIGREPATSALQAHSFPDLTGSG